MTKQAFEMEMVNPQELVEGSELGFKQPRTNYAKSQIKELAEDIALRGLINPLQVWLTKDEKGKTHKVRIGGGRRLEAIKLLIEEKRVTEGPAKGYDKAVPCRIVTDNDPKSAFATAVADNLQREEMTSFEQAESVWHMAMNHGMSGTEISKALSKSNAWTSRMLGCFRECSTATREAWKIGKITQETVRDLISKHRNDHAAMDKTLEKLVKVREVGSKDAKSEARNEAKAGKKGNNDRPTRMQMDFMKVKTEGAPAKFKYVRGVHDGIMYALGLLGLGEFEDDYAEFLKWKDKKESGTETSV